MKFPLGPQIMKLETKLFFVIELYRLIFQALSNLDSNVCTLGADTTFSGKFHGLITLIAKLYFRMSNLDGCVLSLSECPLVVVFLEICKMSQIS